MSQFPSLGSLGEALRRTTGARDPESPIPLGAQLFGSAGPVSDAFIAGTEPMMLLNGPIGSAKTTAEGKKVLLETTRMRPWQRDAQGNPVREYNVVFWREKYDSVWNATLKSWWKIIPRDLGKFEGSPGRPANHTVEWQDEWSPKGGGICRLVAMFRAFGEDMDPEQVRGTEYADGVLQEWDLLPQALTVAISGRLGRAPTPPVMGRVGRMFGSCNAVDVTSYLYEDFWVNPQPGYRLYRQPGGLDPGAENIQVLGREYYDSIIQKNQTRKWYIRRMVDNKPGFTRDTDLVYPAYDDDVHLAKSTIPVYPNIPVVVGIDGGNTPAAVYLQELRNGQIRILAEIALETAGMIALSRAMLTLEASPRFKGCEFFTVGDPAMKNGEETDEGSDRTRLAKLLKRKVRLARTNDPERRREPIAQALTQRLETGEPAFLLDPSCVCHRRGYNQTFAYRRIRGTNERSGIIKGPDSHPCEAGQYASMETGRGHAQELAGEHAKKLAARAKQAKDAGRYNPLKRTA